MRNTTLCYIEKDNKYLMLLRNKKENDCNEGKWIGIGGKFKKKENAEACLLREVREETGLTLTDYHFHGIVFFLNTKWEDEAMYLYTAAGFEGDINYDCPEGELHWVEKNEVMNLNLWEGDKLFLKKLIDGEERFSMTLSYDGDELLDAVEWCSHNGICGGCTYGGMTYEAQRKDKEEKLLKVLTPAFDENTVWEGVLESPLHGRYKNKMEYSFGDEVKGGPVTLGMHKHKCFYSVLTCDDCRIVSEDYNRIVKATELYFNLFRIPYVNRRSHEGYLRHLMIRKSFANGGLLIDLITADMPDAMCVMSENELLNRWKDIILKLDLDGYVAGILHTRNNSLSDAIKDEGTEIIYGNDFIEEELLGLTFKITPFSFFQTNSKGAEVLYGKVREYVGDTTGQTVYDLYSGTGTIAQLVAPVAEKVYGVEIIGEAVEAARDNAKTNGLDNCEFIAGDVLEVIDALEKKPDMIILDPPREGLHPKMLPKIAAYGVKNIVYVACRPASFARDMEYFKTQGYRVVKAAGIDQFPYTKHVESVVLLSHISGVPEK